MYGYHSHQRRVRLYTDLYKWTLNSLIRFFDRHLICEGLVMVMWKSLTPKIFEISYNCDFEGRPLHGKGNLTLSDTVLVVIIRVVVVVVVVVDVLVLMEVVLVVLVVVVIVVVVVVVVVIVLLVVVVVVIE